MKIIDLSIAVIMILLSAPPTARAESPSADEIVAASDAVRNPDKPFSLTTTLIEYREGRQRDKMVLTVYSKVDPQNGQYRSLIRFIEPLRDENKLMLKNGNILWFFDPATKASVRLSAQQRLMGQAANGDVATVNFHKDYAASLTARETITDANKTLRECHKLAMRANNDTVIYYRIEYWVDVENNQPVKGKFYSESERLLKIVYYRGYQAQLGSMRPTEMIIIDGLDSKLVTQMSYSNYAYRDIPEEWYLKEFLPRFKGE